MKRGYLFIVVAALLVAGCDQDTDNDGPFVGGSKGLSLGFEQGAPPTRFSQSQNVPIQLVVNNNGEFEVGSGKALVKLFGIAHDRYSLSGEYKPVNGDLFAVEKDIIEQGGEQTVDMGSLKYTGQISGFIDPTINAKVCYPYETVAQVEVCVSSLTIEQTGGEKVCSSVGEKITSGSVSSGPVQITSLTQDLAANRVIFTLQIQDNGGGRLFKEDATCVAYDDASKRGTIEDVVHVEVMPNEVSCRFLGNQGSSGDVKLRNGAATLICEMSVTRTDASYKELLSFNLGYNYINEASINVRIDEA